MVVTDMRAIMFTLKCWSGKIRSIVKVKNGGKNESKEWAPRWILYCRAVVRREDSVPKQGA